LLQLHISATLPIAMQLSVVCVFLFVAAVLKTGKLLFLVA